MTPLDYASKIAYSSIETLQFSYDMAVKYKDSPGVYVECGVAAGAQVIAMAHGAPNKTIYAFDSFEGIPLPSNMDDQMPGIKYFTEEERLQLPDPGKQKLETTGMTSVSLDDFKDHCVKSGVGTRNIKPVKGWFEYTVKNWSRGEIISILRLDGDLYNSTYVCLKYLYPKLIKGGVLIIDDIQLPGCDKAVNKYFCSKKDIKLQFISNIAYIIKP
jgi:hypothetical protein